MQKGIKRIYLVIIFIAITLCFFAFINPQLVKADDNLTITITKNSTKYVYSINTNEYEFNSLQALIDDAITRVSSTLVCNFDHITSNEGINIKGTNAYANKRVSIQGTITFELSGNEYGITLNPNATLNVFSATINSNRGVIKTEYNSNFTLTTGALVVQNNNSEYNSTVLEINGNAEIKGGTITLDNTTCSKKGYGIVIKEGAIVTLTQEYAINVTASTAIYLVGGQMTINAGTFTANSETSLDSGSPYGFSVYIANAANLTINAGTFNNIIRFEGQAAQLNIQDGTFNEDLSLIYFSNGFQGLIKLKDLQINPPAFSYVNMDLSQISNNKASISGTIRSTINGYKTTGIKINQVNYSLNEEFYINVETTASFNEDNKYTLSIYDGNILYSQHDYNYGKNFVCSELAFSKPGYRIVNYRDELDNTIESFQLTDDTNIYIETELKPIDITLTDKNFTYDSTAKQITPTVTHDLLTSPDAEVIYVWYKHIASDWVQQTTQLSISLTNVNESGSFRFTASITYNEDTINSESEPIEITIEKGNYTNITHPKITGEYNSEKFLKDYDLNANFRWVNEYTVPTVPIKMYPAKYNADSANYNDFALNIEVDLSKVASPASSMSYSVYGEYDKNKTLGTDYSFEKLQYEEPNTVPTAGNNSYKAFYNADPDNYTDIVCYVDITLTKGNYIGNFDLSITQEYSDDNRTLNSIKNFIKNNYPGYKVTNGPSQTVIGDNIFSLKYNEDPDNYNDCICTLTLTITKATIEYIPNHPTVSIQYGNPLSSIQLNNWFRFKNPTLIPQADGEYEALYNSDPEIYNDAETTIYVELILLDYTPNEVPDVNIEPTQYSKGKTLKSISLPQGFTWKDENTLVFVNITEYEATYRGDIHHNPIDVIINLTIQKANYNMPTFEDGTFTYDGLVHSLEISNLDEGITLVRYDNNGKINAGSYTVIAIIDQEDKDNYNLLNKELSATLCIKKAPSIISVEKDRIDILLGEEVEINATVNNDEQSVIIPEYDLSTIGVKTIELTTLESINYLDGSKTIIISVNEQRKIIGDIVYQNNSANGEYYGRISSETGIGEDIVVSFKETNNGVKIEISGEEKNYTVGILMTEELLNAKNLKLIVNNEEIEYTIEAGEYLTFTAKNGDEVIFLYDKNQFNLYWLFLIIPLPLLLIGLTIFMLIKKNIIKFNFKKSKTKDNNSNINKENEQNELNTESESTNTEDIEVKETEINEEFEEIKETNKGEDE